MRRRLSGICIITIMMIAAFSYFSIENKYTYTLTNENGEYKSEEVKPLFNVIKVRGDRDTSVTFIDSETGKEYTIGYITHGMTERITLDRGKWYKVTGSGSLTISPVNVRIEDSKEGN